METGKTNNLKPVIGIHPGSGGSSLNWPPAKYAQLVTMLSEDGYAVTVTGSPAETEFVQRIADDSGANPSIYIGDEGIKKLAEKINGFDVFVAGSTGPLHIAGAVETPAIGIYSPVKVCLPERWGPIGKDDIALLPENIGPCETCVGETCADYNCMENIEVLTVKEAIISILQKKKTAI
jgi:ADP-heptose:LPS heptosyltransferase